jgi:hypothetical protein
MDLIDKHLNKIIEFLIFVDNNNLIMSNKTFIVNSKNKFLSDNLFSYLCQIFP